MLELSNIHFDFDNVIDSHSSSADKNSFRKRLLSGITFQLKGGEIVSLIGSSGSGKTSLFRIITGSLKPKEGSIKVNGLPFDKGKELITYMRQEDLLLPWRTVLNNLLLFSELGKSMKPKRELLDEAKMLLEKVGLKGVEQAYPEELSGGMRQRVSLARALLQKRPLLLLDEPFGSLDVIIREELYGLLRKIAKEEKKTILFVTHDFHDALELANRILILKNGIIAREFNIDENFQNKERLIPAIRSTLIH